VLPVIGEIDNVPKVTQSVVTDPVVKARKNVVEGTAYLELARIFQSMGLSKGAKEKAAEGLARVDEIIRTAAALPVAVRQEAYKIKWELHLAANDLELALATCAMFNRLYPNSPMIDQALMGIADVRLENKQYPDAIKVYRQVLALPKSDAKAKAQFKIAEITESTKQGTLEAAIPLYKVCAEKYPDSEYAGLALAKVIDYYMKTKDYAQANTLLEQVFQDFPDAKFLDTMYLKAVQVAYFSGDFARAAERCSQLLFQYPDSPVAATAKQLLPKIQSKIKTDDEKAVTDAK
jgi:TolA-binding protein